MNIRYRLKRFFTGEEEGIVEKVEPATAFVERTHGKTYLPNFLRRPLTVSEQLSPFVCQISTLALLLKIYIGFSRPPQLEIDDNNK